MSQALLFIPYDLPQAWDPLRHPSDPGNDVAVGDHDPLGQPGGPTCVHDDGDIRGHWGALRFVFCIGGKNTHTHFWEI